MRWNPRTLYEKIFVEPAGCDRFLTHVCTLAWHAPTDCGATFADNCAALAARHPEHHDAIWAWIAGEGGLRRRSVEGSCEPFGR